MADANTMIRCIIGDDEQKIKELQEIRATQKIIYSAIKPLQLFEENHLDFVDNVLLAYHQLRGITIYSYDRKLMNAIKREEKME